MTPKRLKEIEALIPGYGLPSSTAEELIAEVKRLQQLLHAEFCAGDDRHHPRCPLA